MRIGELAERAGTTTRTLRHYEDQGLLAARRASNGYRTYDERDLRVVRQIRTLVENGFALDETRPFVQCLHDGHETGDSCPDSVEGYRRKLREIEDLIGQLGRTRDLLGRQLHEAILRNEHAAPEPHCPYLPETSEDDR